MSLFILRHCQSQANLENLLGGRKDYLLTKQGAKDARQIALEFRQKLGADYPIEHLISSPLLRAKQTAAQFSQVLGLKQIEEEPLLIEQDMGIYTGLSYSELQNAVGYVHDRNLRWNWQPQGGGESYKQIATRVSQFFDKFQKQEQQNTLIVSHAVCMRLIYGYLRNMFPAYLEVIPHNGEIWQVNNLRPDSQNQIISHYFNGYREANA